METIDLKDPESREERIAFLDAVLGALLSYHRHSGLVPSFEARSKFFDAAIGVLKSCKKNNVVKLPIKKRSIKHEETKTNIIHRHAAKHDRTNFTVIHIVLGSAKSSRITVRKKR